MLKGNIKNIYKTAFVIIGTIIGAGFASGQISWNIYIYNFNSIYNI